MKTRAAASPRSASPIGPAPTRLPRIALPLATVYSLVRSGRAGGRPGCHPRPVPSAGEALDQAETDDGSGPDQTDGDGEAVEVALGDRGPAHGAGHAAAEHVGETAALALVEQDEQGQEQASQDQDDLEADLHCFHVRCTILVVVVKPRQDRPAGCVPAYL